MYSLFFTEKEPNLLDAKVKYQKMSKSNKLFPYVYENKNNVYNRSTIKHIKLRRLIGKNSMKAKNKEKTENISKFIIEANPIIFTHNLENKHHTRESSIENRLTAKEVLGELINFADNLELDFEIPHRENEDQDFIKSFLNEATAGPGQCSTGEDIFLTKMQNPIIKKSSENNINYNLKNKTDINTNYSEGYTTFKDKYMKTGEVLNTKHKTKNQFNTQSTLLKRKYIEPTPQLELNYNTFKDKVKDKNNFINKISSFELKVNRELGKIIKGYGKNDKHIRFSDNPIVSTIYAKMPKFEVYKTMKVSESRPTHGYRFKLAPLRHNPFDKKNKISYNIYYFSDRRS